MTPIIVVVGILDHLVILYIAKLNNKGYWVPLHVLTKVKQIGNYQIHIASQLCKHKNVKYSIICIVTAVRKTGPTLVLPMNF